MKMDMFPHRRSRVASAKLIPPLAVVLFSCYRPEVGNARPLGTVERWIEDSLNYSAS